MDSKRKSEIVNVFCFSSANEKTFKIFLQTQTLVIYTALQTELRHLSDEKKSSDDVDAANQLDISVQSEIESRSNEFLRGNYLFTHTELKEWIRFFFPQIYAKNSSGIEKWSVGSRLSAFDVNDAILEVCVYHHEKRISVLVV